MRNLIRTVALLALLGIRGAMAQTMAGAKSPAGSAIAAVPSSPTRDARRIDGAPVGHRQPRAPDVPAESAGALEHIGEEDIALDRKLIICRGC